MRQSLTARVRRLADLCRPRGGIHWDNLLADRPEDVIPDGVLDWHGLLFGAPATDTPAGPTAARGEWPGGHR